MPSVTAFLRRPSDGWILAVRLRAEGRWTLPGGLIELGESPASALVRETLEETNIEVEPVSVLGVFGGPDGFRRTYTNGDQVECSETLFECRLSKHATQVVDDEIESSSFVDPTKLRDWIYPVRVDLLCEAADNHRTMFGAAGVPHLSRLP